MIRLLNLLVPMDPQEYPSFQGTDVLLSSSHNDRFLGAWESVRQAETKNKAGILKKTINYVRWLRTRELQDANVQEASLPTPVTEGTNTVAHLTQLMDVAGDQQLEYLLQAPY